MISWEAALDEGAEGFAEVAQRSGPETVWSYFCAGTIGLVQRDGIGRLRHAMRYSRESQTTCSSLSDSGWASTGTDYARPPAVPDRCPVIEGTRDGHPFRMAAAFHDAAAWARPA